MHHSKKLILAAFVTSLLTGAAYAQDTNAQVGASGAVKMDNPNAAKPLAPGQQQNAGKVDGASDAAPGQKMKDGSVDAASDSAPGQLKTQTEASGATDGTGKGDRNAMSGDATKEGQKAGTSASGQADAGGGAGVSSETTAAIDLSAEQRTEVKQVFTTQSVEPVSIDFDVSVGVAVPRTVTLHAVPPRIVEIVPAYEGYEYFVLADGRIVIVEPGTLHVVYILV